MNFGYFDVWKCSPSDKYMLTDCRSEFCNNSIVSNEGLGKIGILILLLSVDGLSNGSLFQFVK